MTPAVDRARSDPGLGVVCADVDGTLISTDLVWESWIALLKRRPMRAVVVLLALVRGRVHFTRLVAAESPLDPASLPCREELVARLGQVRRRGAARSLISAMRPHQWAKNALIF